jgi:putative transposase
VILNSVRAGMCAAPEQWPWSSYAAMMGSAPAPRWLAVEVLLSQFGSSREEARRRYRAFVYEGSGQDIWQGLRQQIYLQTSGNRAENGQNIGHCSPGLPDTVERLFR